MGKHKKNKSHKKKKEHKKATRSPTPSDSSASSSDSESSAREKAAEANKPKSAKEIFNEYLGKNSEANWHLSQKSEMLLFEANKEPEKNETFVWRKKNQKIGLDKLDAEKILLLNRLKQEETARELEKLKKRKIEREREREERERERESDQRQKEVDYHKEWEKQEDSFHLHQVKLRSKIRIEEGRAKPIDLLAKYIDAESDNLAIEMHEPYMYLNGLTMRDLEDLIVDIKVYTDLEHGTNVDYWRDIQIVTEEELKKLQKLDKNARDHEGDRREGINQSVLQDVTTIFRGKNYDELIQLEVTINKKIKEESGIDIGYWESLLAQLKAHMARARLKDRHRKVLYEKLEKMKKQQQNILGDKRRGEKTTASTTTSNYQTEFERKLSMKISKEEEKLRNQPQQKASKDSDDDDDEDEDEFDKMEKFDEKDDLIKINKYTLAIEEYQNGDYSPELLNSADLPFDTFIITQEEDQRRLEVQRKQVLGTGYVKPDLEDEFEQKAMDTMGGIIPSSISKEMLAGGVGDEDETTTSKQQQQQSTLEMPIEHQHYLWSDKYRPRKPRYYNRVHTGYDWNQYNKKHYDVDNPPPKTVQGYKFNIFYPDLIDKTKTPRYSITPCSDNKEFALLRFSAGAPYEDVAFKIVNKEWDISYRHGFRNQFQNGIYQLWFHFRRWKYRR